MTRITLSSGDKQNTGKVFVRKMGAFLIESSISLWSRPDADVLMREIMSD